MRLEFWGDTVEEIRWFKVVDQRTPRDRVAGPVGAAVPRAAAHRRGARPRQGALQRRTPSSSRCSTSSPTAPRSTAWSRSPRCSPTAWSCSSTCWPEGSLVVVCDPERVRTRAHDLVATSEEFLEASWHNAAAGNVTPIDLRSAAYRSVADVRHAALQRGVPWWGASPFGGDVAADDVETLDPDAIDRVTLDVRPADSYRGETTRALHARRATCWRRAGRSSSSRPGHGTAERIAESVRGEGLAVRVAESLDDVPEPGLVTVVTGALDHGFARAVAAARGAHRDRPRRAEVHDARHAPHAHAPAPDHRPAAAQDRRLRRARAARRRPVRRDGAAHGGGRDARVPRRRVRARQARPARRPALRADRPARPGDALRRRRVAEPAPDRRRRLGQDQGARPQGGARDRGRADPALRRPHGEPRARVLGRTPSWQRELEDAFPYAETPDQLSTHRRGQGRHGERRSRWTA